MTIDSFGKLGWTSTSDERLVQELEREVAAGHCLHGVAVQTVAKCGDDVLFQLLESPDVSNPAYAEVHLTYKTNGPDLPPWPTTQLYESMTDWLEKLEGSTPDTNASMNMEPRRSFGLTMTTWVLLPIIILLLWLMMTL